jgi:hypothetical protein
MFLYFVRNCLKKKSDEKEKANQACEDHKKMFSIVHHEGGIHGEHPSHKKTHMDNQIDDGFTMHGREESDGDSMRQSRYNIIDQKSHSPCMNKTH